MARRKMDLFGSPFDTGRVISMINGPLPVAVFQAALPRTRATCALNVCHFSLDLTRVVSCLDHFHLSPDGRLSPKSVICLTMACTIAPHLHFPSAFTVPLVVAQIPQPTDGTLLQTTPSPGDSPDGAMILVQKVSECPWFEDLRTEWCHRCGIPVQTASVWS